MATEECAQLAGKKWYKRKLLMLRVDDRRDDPTRGQEGADGGDQFRYLLNALFQIRFGRRTRQALHFGRARILS